MVNKVKKLFVIGALMTGLFMSISACDVFSTPSNNKNSSSNDIVSNSTPIHSAADLESITVTPKKDTYEWGEDLDVTVTANYNDGTSSEVTGYEIDGYNNQSSGLHRVTVTYQGKTSTFYVIVNDPVLLGITVVNNKESYEWGENLDITVLANYSDGSSTEVTDYQLTGYNQQISGNQTVLVSYEGYNYSFGVKVNDPILLSIDVIDNKDGTYEWGEDLDISVTATYSDGNTVEVTGYQVEGYDSETSGTHTIIVTYEGETYTYDVVVNDPVLVSITATSAKDTYEWNEDLDIVVKAHYSDHSERIITDYDVEGYNPKTSGEQTVTITFEGETCSFKVTVNDPALTGITAISNKDNYSWGDDLDITVYATYADGSVVEVTGYQVEGFNSEEAGLQTLSVSYEGKSCSLKVSVAERENLFPVNRLNAFIQFEDIKAEIPSPIGYDTWTNETDEEQDGSRYFLATTKDEGTVGVDSIADQYAIVLKTSGWNVTSNSNVYTATKDNGDAELTFSTSNEIFSLRVLSLYLYPNRGYQTVLVSSSSDIKDGDTIILGGIDQQYVATNLSNGSLSTETCNYVDNVPESISKAATRFTVNKSGNNWTLTDNDGRKLGATGANALAWDNGDTNWSFYMSGQSAIISSTTRDYGRLYYNLSNNKISCYKSSRDSNLVYPQIFKLVLTDLVYPTAISISGNNEVATNKTSKLTLEYTPANTNVFNDVTWSSSNKNVVTVENGVISGVSVGNAVITAQTTSKGNPLEAAYNVTVTETPQASWTIMLYICGSNLESEGGYASSDISEILSVSNQPDDVNIIMETGGSRSWEQYGIDANSLSRYHVENKSLVLDEKVSKASMGKQSTFESFLNWGLANYPANKTGVILWNHGGALDGCCNDENYGNDALLNSEASKAFDNAFKQNNISKLEFVGYDCCLMQVQDIAEFNSHYFKYMVASEETESGYGWDYDNWVDDLYAGKDTATILKATCDSFVSSVGNNSDQTLSYLDLSKMNDYYTKFEAMASAIKTTVKNNYSTFKSIVESAKDFGDIYQNGYFYNGLTYCGTVDGYDLLNKLEGNSTFSSFESKFEEVKTAYKKLVVYSKKGSQAGNANGLVVMATTSYYVSYPSSETSFTNWRSLFN